MGRCLEFLKASEALFRYEVKVASLVMVMAAFKFPFPFWICLPRIPWTVLGYKDRSMTTVVVRVCMLICNNHLNGELGH